MVTVMAEVMATATVGDMVTATGVMPMRNSLKAITQIWKVCITFSIILLK